MANNFEKLKAAIISAPINNTKMTDLVKNGTYKIAIEDGKDAKGADIQNYFLVCDVSKKRTPVTANGLAAMRIVESAEKAVLVVNTREARNAEGYRPLQAAVASEQIHLDDKTTFTVCHHLNILDPITNEAYYKNDKYNGYPAYLKASRKAATLTGTDRQTAFTEALDALRATGLKSDVKKDVATEMLQMPVFTVTA